MAFQLHPQLEKDAISLGRLTLCRVLLMNDSQFPWLVLVPEIDGLTEIYQLNPAQRATLMEESCLIAETLTKLYRPDKLNIAAIGNLVPQLHVHHIVRYRTDKAWPAPVWGKFDRIPYTKERLAEIIGLINSNLKWD